MQYATLHTNQEAIFLTKNKIRSIWYDASDKIAYVMTSKRLESSDSVLENGNICVRYVSRVQSCEEGVKI
jgi:hypothetical protein